MGGRRKRRKGLPAATMRPLVQLQNRCPRRVTRAYKRAPAAALDKDADIMPLASYMKLQAYKYTIDKEGIDAEVFIKQRCRNSAHELRFL
jgi:hypothetical protein